MKKEINNFIIEYSEIDSEYIDIVINELLLKQQSILKFFELEKLNHKVHIKFWNDYQSYREYFSDYWEVLDWEVGNAFSTKEKNEINMMSLRERRKCQGHQNDTVENMIKVMVHEFVHTCHAQYKNYKNTLSWFNEALATNLAEQYDKQNLKLDCSLDDLLAGNTNYYNYYSLGNYILSNYSHEYVLRLARDNDFLEKETPKLFNEAKIYINNYLNQDLQHPTYFFHGSNKPLNRIDSKQSHDSLGTKENMDYAIFVTPSFIMASAYAFKNSIKEKSQQKGFLWDFNIKQHQEFPIMTMENVFIDDDIHGYIYVFKNNGKFINEPKDSLQYKYYGSLTPIDCIYVSYKDYQNYFEVKNQENIKNK